MGQREPGIIPAAEWGERPREKVTVMPAASRISQIRKALLPDRCLWQPGVSFSQAEAAQQPHLSIRGPEFKPLRPRFLGKFAIETFA